MERYQIKAVSSLELAAKWAPWLSIANPYTCTTTTLRFEGCEHAQAAMCWPDTLCDDIAHTTSVTIAALRSEVLGVCMSTHTDLAAAACILITSIMFTQQSFNHCRLMESERICPCFTHSTAGTQTSACIWRPVL